MAGGIIVVGERELSVPDSCQGNHVFNAQEAIERGLKVQNQSDGNGNTAENCAFCNHSIVVQFKDGKPVKIIKSESTWR